MIINIDQVFNTDNPNIVAEIYNSVYTHVYFCHHSSRKSHGANTAITYTGTDRDTHNTYTDIETDKETYRDTNNNTHGVKDTNTHKDTGRDNDRDFYKDTDKDSDTDLYRDTE